jgi:hypothetical protein
MPLSIPDWQIRDGQLMGGFQFIIQKAHSYPWTIVGIIFRKPHACSSYRGMLKTTFVDLKKISKYLPPPKNIGCRAEMYMKN